jgi:DNA-binding MarR family transcriptional regulator
MESLPNLTEVTTGMQAAMHASREVASRIARDLGMPVTDVTAVGLLLQLGPMTVGTLARRLDVRTASATVLVDRLVAAGRVVRRPHPDDRRSVLVEVTPAGAAESWAHWEPVIRAMDAVARAMTPDERAVVVRYLAAVTAAAG